MELKDRYKEIKKEWKKRAVKIVKLHDEEDMTFAEIGTKFCITRQRAQQIYNSETGK